MAAGRPREFDYDRALEQAMYVFWKKGYEGTSLPDLTAAMGINRPSLYACFGNKEELYCKALKRYSEKSRAIVEEQLSAPKIHDAIENFLVGAASSLSCPSSPHGCLSVQGALVCGEEAETAKKQSAERREELVKILKERIDRAVAEKDLPVKTDSKDLARFFVTILQGMSVQSAGGTSEKELKAIARRALQALPQAA